MGVLAEFEASSTDLVLGPTLEAMPSLDVDLERQYALDPAHPISFCWARCPDIERLERALTSDRTVETFDRLARSGDWALYRIKGSDDDVVHAYRRWVSIGGELLECQGSDGRWVIHMRFPDRDAFARYHAFLEREGVEFALHRLADDESDSPNQTDGTVLTDSQREALALAFEHGFFEVPRETDLSTIASDLGISNQAVSERLRRGQARLIEEQLL